MTQWYTFLGWQVYVSEWCIASVMLRVGAVRASTIEGRALSGGETNLTEVTERGVKELQDIDRGVFRKGGAERG